MLQVICRTATQLAAPLLRPMVASPAPDAAALPARLAAAAGGGSGAQDGTVDADEVCELLLAALEAQRAADAAQIEVGCQGALQIADQALD